MADSRTHMRKWAVAFILGAIIACAGFVRLYDLNWDSGQHLHPDERFISIVAVDRIKLDVPTDLPALLNIETSPLNPRSIDPATNQARNFAYGAFPLYVTDLVSSALTAVTGTPWWNYDHLNLVGRALTAIADTLSVYLLYFTGRLLRRRRTGLIAAALYAFAVIAIQNAHFFTFDSWMTLFVLASVYFALSAMFNSRTYAYALSGVCLGLALASKSAALPFIAVIIVLAIYVIRGTGRSRRKRAALASLPFAAAAITLAIADPYAILGIQEYARDLAEQAAIARGSVDMPYTRQFVGTLPIIYQLQTAGAWGLGIPLLAASLAGVVLHGYRAFAQRSKVSILLVIATMFYLGLIFLFDAKHPRYLLPAFPLLVLLGASALDEFSQWLSGRLRSKLRLRRSLEIAVAIPTATVLLLTVLWALSFLSIYGKSHARVEASDWIYQNVPAVCN